MISSPVTISQIDAWRAQPESEHLEFKEARQGFSSTKLLEYCVAISNEGGGYLLLGINDKPPRHVVSTKAFQSVKQISEDIFNKLHFRVDVQAVQHPNGRVVVFHIPSRPIGEARQIDGKYLMRLGESLRPMTPEQLKKIHNEVDRPGPSKDRAVRWFSAFVATILLFAVGLWFVASQTSHSLLVNHRTTDSPDITQPPEGSKRPVKPPTSVPTPENKPNKSPMKPPTTDASQDFVVSEPRALINLNRNFNSSLPIWVRYSSAYGDTISPVAVALYLDLTSKISIPERVKDYQVAMNVGACGWLYLTPIRI